MTSPRSSLSALLDLDAATCGLMGVLLTVAAGPIASLTALPQPLIFWAGILLLPCAAFMAFSARLQPVPHWAALLVVLGNAGWVLASLALPLAGLVTPNPLGWAFLLAQALVVAVLAILERAAVSRDLAVA